MGLPPKVKALWRTGQHGWPPHYPLVQLPNAPLIGALGALPAAALTRGPARSYAVAAHYASLAAWAFEELTDGANAARRVLGAGGLAYVVARLTALIRR